MNKVVKQIIYMLIRLLITFLIVLIILILLELILKTKKQKEYSQKEEYLIKYYEIYNNMVNTINSTLNETGFWNYELSDYTITINNQARNPKKKKILVVGDSFVWGWAQDNMNNIWWRQLEYMLKQNGYQDVEIIAAGMNGFSIVDETEKIILNKEYIKKINPDLIIIGYVSNDFEIWDEKDPDFLNKINDNFNEKEYIKNNIDRGIIKKLKQFFPYLHDQIIRVLMNKEYSKKEFKDKYGYTNEELKKQYLSNKYLKRIEKRAILPLSKIKTPIIVVNLPFGEKMYGKDPILFQDKVFRLLDKYNIENYDLKNKYNKNFKGLDYITKLQVNIGDYHPGTRVMNFYSKEIYNILKNKHPDIIGKQTKKFKNKKFRVDYTLPKSTIKKINNNTYEISSIPVFLLEYPYTNKKYIKVNLEYPTKINKLYIRTKNIVTLSVKADLYSEKLGYENKKNIEIEGIKIKDNEYLFDFKNKNITSINIASDQFFIDDMILEKKD